MKRSFLDQTYEIVKGPPAPTWETYEALVMSGWTALLDSDPTEPEVQRYLEKHPSLLPGYRSMTITSGHTCFPPAAFTQPPLAGLTKKIPDFMWIAQASDSIFPVLIEIERPGKRWFKKDRDQTAELGHARQQLVSWRSWFRNPTNQQWFREYYELTGTIHQMRAIQPAYVLIYGRRSEFSDEPELNKLRAELPGDHEYYMTFDRLGLDSWSRDFVTCRKPSPYGYEVIDVPATLAWGPRHVDEFVRMRGWEAAIARCEYLPEDRRAFLLERMPYWFSWVRDPSKYPCVTRGERE
jgi:Domain of unknown function (DUF4263)